MAIIFILCLPIGEWKQASEWDFFTPDMSVTIVRVAEKRQEQAIETSVAPTKAAISPGIYNKIMTNNNKLHINTLKNRCI